MSEPGGTGQGDPGTGGPGPGGTEPPDTKPPDTKPADTKPADTEPAAHRAVEVLLVDPEPLVAERLAAALAENAAPAEGDVLAEDTAGAQSPEQTELRLSRVARWTEAAERIDRGEVDVVLLGLPGGDQGVLPLVELRSRAPELPVVVLASAADEPLAVKAVQLGATDYLLTERLYGTLVTRCVLHAVEAERVRARLRERQAQWPPSLRPLGESPGRAASLRTALPQSFDELVGEYGRLLDHAVEQVLYRVDHALDSHVRHLARRAGELRAGPRDVVEIHATAIKAKEQEAGPQRMRLYAAEGQVRLLELMGHLVTFYRLSSLPGTGRGGGA